MSIPILDTWHSIIDSDARGKSPNDFERLGHPGKWLKSIKVDPATIINLTGSNYGASGIIITNNDCDITLSGGGVIPGSTLATNTIHELSISRLDTKVAGVVYVLFRNHLVR